MRGKIQNPVANVRKVRFDVTPKPARKTRALPENVVAARRRPRQFDDAIVHKTEIGNLGYNSVSPIPELLFTNPIRYPKRLVPHPWSRV